MVELRVIAATAVSRQEQTDEDEGHLLEAGDHVVAEDGYDQLQADDSDRRDRSNRMPVSAPSAYRRG